MSRMFFAISVLLAGISGASAQQRVYEARQGQWIAIYSACYIEGGTPYLAGSADNGRVERVVRDNVMCGAVRSMMTTIMYTPNPGFRGTDSVYVIMDGYDSRRFRVNVR